MAKFAKIFMQTFLKVINLVVGMVGIAMVLYGFWMVRVWQRDMEASSFPDFNSTSPWFIYTFLGTGVSFCIITCLGHIAADTANSFCLFCYMVILSVLLLLETAIGVDILLNSDWEKDLPEDPTGKFHDFSEFVKSNFDVLKWIGLLIILAQGFSAVLAMALRALGPNTCSNYDSDDGYTPTRLPLMNHHLQPPAFVIGEPRFASENEAWKANK